MIRIKQSFTVNRPVAEVFHFMTEAGNIFKYSRSIEEIRQITKEKLEVGARYHMVSRFMGQRVPIELEVTEFVQDRKVSSRSTSGPFKLSATTRFEAQSNGNTLVTQESEIQPTGFWRAIEPVLPGMIRRRSEAEQATLVKLLESDMQQTDEHAEIVDISKTIVLLEH